MDTSLLTLSSPTPVLSRRQLFDLGIGDRALKALVQGGVYAAIRPGRYVAREQFDALKPEAQVVVRAQALASVSRNRPVFSHETAAALLGLPLYRADTRVVHISAPEPRSGAAQGVVRHRGSFGQHIVEVDGMLCTSLELTTADVARTASPETAIAVADAALRTVSVEGPGHYNVAAANEMLRHLLEFATSASFGASRAQKVLEFADGRAQLPGESVSRLQLARLGFAPPKLQVYVAGPRGRDYWVDFGLDDVNVFGEFDGFIKYTDPVMLAGRTPQQVLRDEKEREDWIRGTTRRMLLRWVSADIRTAAALGAKLAAFGIRPLR